MIRAVVCVGVIGLSGQAMAREFATVCHFKGQPETRLILSTELDSDQIIRGQERYPARNLGGSTGIPGHAWSADIGGKEVILFVNASRSRLIRNGHKDLPGSCRSVSDEAR